jgi:hypothetical protein
METFNKLSEVFNVNTEIVSTSIDSAEIEKFEVEDSIEDSNISDSTRDYEYTRTQLYSLIEKGQTAVNGILDVASNTDHPRAYEVAGQLIKNVADMTDKLIDLQKKMKDLDDKYKVGPKNVTNALFVGSTAELSKLLKEGILNSKEENMNI